MRSLPPAQLRSLEVLQREVPLVQSPRCSLPAMQEMLGLFGQGTAPSAASRQGQGRGARGRVRAPRRGGCATDVWGRAVTATRSVSGPAPALRCWRRHSSLPAAHCSLHVFFFLMVLVKLKCENPPMLEEAVPALRWHRLDSVRGAAARWSCQQRGAQKRVPRHGPPSVWGCGGLVTFSFH